MSAIVLMIVLLAAGHSKAGEVCGRKLDILLLVDGSSTVCDGTETCQKWTSTLEFCKNIVNSFKIGPDDTKIAFILMSDKFHVKWNLDGHTNETTLLPAIDNVKYTGGVFTKLSLISTLSFLTVIFNPLPISGNRPEALNIIIFITDGIPAIGDLLAAAFSTAYQQFDIAAFVVCVQPGCPDHWARAISSSPQKVNETYFLADGYFLLDPVKDNVVNKICTYELQPFISGLVPAP